MIGSVRSATLSEALVGPRTFVGVPGADVKFR